MHRKFDLKKRRSLLLVMCLLISGGALFVKSAIVPAKALIAPYLLNHAWQESMQNSKGVRPWPWMDSEPVARLTFLTLDKSFIVLRGVSGTVMAFAPGWHEGSAKIGQGGATIISAHRDTHFTALRHVKIGDEIVLQTMGGQDLKYQVTDLSITQTPKIYVPEDEDSLYLVTCYPFDEWGARTAKRYIVKAMRKS